MTYLLCAVLFWGRKTSSVKKTAETLNTIFARDFCIFAKMNPKYKWVVIANAFDAILKSLYRPAGEKFCLNALNQQWVLHKLYITLLYLNTYLSYLFLRSCLNRSSFSSAAKCGPQFSGVVHFPGGQLLLKNSKVCNKAMREIEL